MLRLKVSCSIVMLCVVAHCAQPAMADVLQNDFQKLQGVWTLYYAEWEGSSFLPGANVRLAISDHQYMVAPNTGAATVGNFALYQMSWPRQINYVPFSGPAAGQTCLGIYSVIGNVQVVCFVPPGQPRPTDFSTFPGSGRMLNVWLRQP
ncbi:MAG TPA: TIGR03067 domain-containing protein [Pirellulales bacterium]|nr:TIGR03067 domain-containing protein [Pirellulales bacterium]